MATKLLFRGAAVLLALGAAGHTFGGMLGTASRGPGAGPEAERVLADMKSVHFQWRGNDSTWFAFWMGNGLGVSALLVLAVGALWILGGAERGRAGPLVPLAWVATASIALLSALGFAYFGTRIGAVFGIVAALSLAGALSIGGRPAS